MSHEVPTSFKILEFLEVDELDPIDAFMLGQEYAEAEFGRYEGEVTPKIKFEKKYWVEFLVIYTGEWDEEYVAEHFEEYCNDTTYS